MEVRATADCSEVWRIGSLRVREESDRKVVAIKDLFDQPEWGMEPEGWPCSVALP